MEKQLMLIPKKIGGFNDLENSNIIFKNRRFENIRVLTKCFEEKDVGYGYRENFRVLTKNLGFDHINILINSSSFINKTYI